VIKNEDYWLEVEALEPFANRDDPGSAEHRACAWKWLGKLQAGRGLTQLQIIQLQGLLQNVYLIGVHDGKAALAGVPD